mgnify:CR=1 FL=1
MPEPPNPGSFPELQAFREVLTGPSDLTVLEALIPRLKASGLLEQALLELKRSHPRKGKDDPWAAARSRLEKEVAQERNRRMGSWQLDPRRCSLRLRLEILPPACQLHPPAQQALLAQAFLDAGLPLAMGLERTPRPLVRWGHPLPQGVAGLSEWADVVLRLTPEGPLESLPERINASASAGLRVLEVAPLSNHASPVLELCREARWVWDCPPQLAQVASARLSSFQAAATFQIEKTGKVGGQKQVKPVEVRHLVRHMAWEGDRLLFTTRLSAGEALNPIKLLAGVLGMETSAITGLTRAGVDLSEDARLAQMDKYEPKLHNIYEDAVLLESGSHIRIIDEDDDEPLVLR